MDATKLTITLKPNGDVNVHGPIDNLMLCYGLLDIAKDVIRARIQQKKAQSPIIQPVALLPGNGRH